MTAAPPTTRALRKHHKRIQGMLDDPECAGDLLALGLAVARYVDFDPDFRSKVKVEKPKTFEYFARQSLAVPLRVVRVMVGGIESTETQSAVHQAVRRVLRDDIRRYDMFKEPENRHWVCKAPMIRRDGICGKATNRSTSVVDLDTGRRYMIGSCSRHHEWFEQTVRRNRLALKTTSAPTPPANNGGVLARHLPELNWEKVYLSIEPDWKPPPENNPYTKPTFTLLLGDDTDEAAGERPALSVVRGAEEGVNIDGAAT